MESINRQKWMRSSSQEASFGLKFFRRFWKLCGLIFPSWCCASVWMTLFLLALSLLEQVVIYYIGLVPSKFYQIFADKNQSVFLVHVIYSIGLILAEALILSIKSYVGSALYILWRRSIGHSVHSLYFTDISFYRLNVVERTIDNPDQRMTKDIDHMCKTFSDVLVPIIVIPFTTGYYLYQCWLVTGYLGPVSSVIFFIIFTIINKLLMTKVSRYFYQQEKMEGNFRFQHMQIRVNAESAAFFQAEKVEEQKANEKLERVLTTQSRLIVWQFVLNCFINMADYLGSILSYIAISFPIFSGIYNNLSPGDLSSLISQNSFYSMYLINCFTKLIDQSAQMTDVIGTAHRIGQLFEELQRLKKEKPEDRSLYVHTPDRHVQNGTSPVAPSALEVCGLTYGQPKSFRMLCQNLTFQLSSHNNILVMGDSGCGKTSLLRVLCGLWQPTSGVVVTNLCLGPTGILYLPQKPYFTDGTLREQIIYPLQEIDVVSDDVQIGKYLQLVGLGDLLDRIGGLDTEADFNWYDQLSPGEMQRLSFVRLFFHRSPYAILDEATSQVSEEMEQLLYKTCSDLGITVMSVGHRSTIRAYHHMELRLQGDGGWALSPISSSLV